MHAQRTTLFVSWRTVLGPRGIEPDARGRKPLPVVLCTIAHPGPPRIRPSLILPVNCCSHVGHFNHHSARTRSGLPVDHLVILFEILYQNSCLCGKNSECPGVVWNTTCFRIFQGARATFRQNVCRGNEKILPYLF